ncbi:MAG: HEAT repeat domain-containing protein [Anaerolineae bacterium]|nr:HEAT repeat domain-containing protein [Anaerolineae bacterium]
MIETLTQQLHHLDRNVRSRAALDLGNLGDQSALDVLIHALYTEMDFYVREDITWALVRMGSTAVQPLIDLLGHSNPAARHHAAHVLGKIGDARAVDALINTLQDSDVTVLTKTIFTLGQLGDVQAAPAIVHLLGHENHEVQTTVANALERFGNASLPLLIDALTHERWQVREQAAEILGLIGDKETIPALATLLTDEHWQVRFAAVTALSHIGGADAKEAIQAMHNDPDQRVRGLVPKVVKRLKS